MNEGSGNWEGWFFQGDRTMRHVGRILEIDDPPEVLEIIGVGRNASPIRPATERIKKAIRRSGVGRRLRIGCTKGDLRRGIRNNNRRVAIYCQNQCMNG